MEYKYCTPSGMLYDIVEKRMEKVLSSWHTSNKLDSITGRLVTLKNPDFVSVFTSSSPMRISTICRQGRLPARHTVSGEKNVSPQFPPKTIRLSHPQDARSLNSFPCNP